MGATLNPLHAVLTLSAAFTPTQRRLAGCAAVLAAVLLFAYVQTLQRWMVRGAEMREAQRSFVLKAPPRLVVAGPQKVAQRRGDAQNTDPKTTDSMTR